MSYDLPSRMCVCMGGGGHFPGGTSSKYMVHVYVEMGGGGV